MLENSKQPVNKRHQGTYDLSSLTYRWKSFLKDFQYISLFSTWKQCSCTHQCLQRNHKLAMFHVKHNRWTLHCQTRMFNSMILPNPKMYEAIYSTTVFLNKHLSLSGLCCRALTFDQSLYLKAEKNKARQSWRI